MNSNNQIDEAQGSERVAAEVVRLIEQKSGEGTQAALTLLRSVYQNSDKVVQVYELACLVVSRRSLEKDREDVGICPEADSLAIQASKALFAKDTERAFILLKLALSSGARAVLCRQVVFQMLKHLRPKDRISELYVDPENICSIEIGRFPGIGLVMYQNTSSPFHLRLWQSERKSDPDTQAIFLRNEVEVEQDSRSRIHFYPTFAHGKTLMTVNWLRYFNSLNAKS